MLATDIHELSQASRLAAHTTDQDCVTGSLLPLWIVNTVCSINTPPSHPATVIQNNIHFSGLQRSPEVTQRERERERKRERGGERERQTEKERWRIREGESALSSFRLINRGVCYSYWNKHACSHTLSSCGFLLKSTELWLRTVQIHIAERCFAWLCVVVPK